MACVILPRPRAQVGMQHGSADCISVRDRARTFVVYQNRLQKFRL